jgi:hypothetical protein
MKSFFAIPPHPRPAPERYMARPLPRKRGGGEGCGNIPDALGGILSRRAIRVRKNGGGQGGTRRLTGVGKKFIVGFIFGFFRREKG